MRQRISALRACPEFWLTCLLLWLLLSACRSLETPWARAALTEALRWGAGIGLMLALGRTLRQTNLALRAVTILAGTMALMGLWDGIQPERGGAVGPYHDHQLYGSALLILLPFPVALALTAPEAAWRRGATAAAAAGAVCLVLSQTRSAWAGLLAAALVFAGLWCYRSGFHWRQGRLILASALFLVCTITALCLLIGSPDLRDPLTKRANTFSALGTDGSWQDRLTLWRGAARLTAAHPLLGIGLGRYPGAQHFWTRTGRSLDPTTRPSLSEEAHDFYLQTAAETGLVGLGLYLAVLTAFTLQGLRRLRQARGRRLGSHEALLIAVLSLLAGQAVDAVASPSWQFAETSLFFWAMLGIGLAALRRPEQESAPQAAFLPVRRLGQFAVSGGAAVALAAHLLPLGLLSPVEAYNHANTVTFDHATVTQITAGCPTGSLCFSLTAYYSDGRSHDVTFDNGTKLDNSAGTPAHFACSSGSPNYLGACSGTFGTSGTRNQYVKGTNDSGKAVRMTGTFQDNTYSGSTFTGQSQKSAHLDLSLP